ncbi:hypothetical protein M405DRAFT_809122 [Rhizopogon salebrosus TDB-379]|nr:hypothetical protein M405DRAFT_809122 [Rhizopogon salebrosus TDB-379]
MDSFNVQSLISIQNGDVADSTRSARLYTSLTFIHHHQKLPRWGPDIQRCASCLEFVPAPHPFQPLRMADGDTSLRVQQNEKLSMICGFSSSSHLRRELDFQGLLTMRRFTQLFLLTGQLGQLIRIDPFGVLPCVLSLKVVAHLDATSLCRAAQVSKW